MEEEIIAFYFEIAPYDRRDHLIKYVSMIWNIPYSQAAAIWQEYINRFIAQGDNF